MSEPSVVSTRALSGVRVALSVSASADLSRLGLTETHCELVVAELARAIVLAGGTLIYGGRITPEGYTTILIDEAQRYQEGGEGFRIYLAEPEYRKLSFAELDDVDQRLGVAGSLTLIDGAGEHVIKEEAHAGTQTVTDAEAYSALRRVMAHESDARVVVGGQLAGYKGVEPGVIEEARLSGAAGAKLYVAGGYGGAAAAIARALDVGNLADWLPDGVPIAGNDEPIVESLARLTASVDGECLTNGLTADDQRLLSSTHRPGDIATLVVRGLAATAH